MYLLFSEILTVMINWLQDFLSSNSVCNHIRDWKIRLPAASRSSDFDNHSYDYRPNRTRLGPITIIYNMHVKISGYSFVENTSIYLKLGRKKITPVLQANWTMARHSIQYWKWTADALLTENDGKLDPKFIMLHLQTCCTVILRENLPKQYGGRSREWCYYRKYYWNGRKDRISPGCEVLWR